MNKRIFIACDTNKISTAKKIINSTRTNKINIGYKFGLEFWNSKNGRSFISKLKNKVIFADLKLLDIPNTCRSAIKSIKDLKNINYLTVHVSGGLKMLKTISLDMKKLDIALPVLNEESILKKNVMFLYEFLDKNLSDIEWKIIIVDNIKYEKVQWKFSPSLEHRFIGLYPLYSEIAMEFESEPDKAKRMYTMQKDYATWKMHYCGDFSRIGHEFECITIFQVLVPTMTLEPSDTVTLKWTILREIN